MKSETPVDTVSTELIVVRRLPVIDERLRSMKESVDKRVEAALSMVCTDETVQSVKAERAKLNQEYAILEDQRKAAKKAVLEPYERFEKIYKECVSDAFRRADVALKGKINDVESEQKRRCEEGLRAYFAELCAVYQLDWLTYERAGVKVDMASAKAKTPAKLRRQLAEFVTGVSDSVNMIAGMEEADEIMVEFRRTLDAAQAISTVLERHRRIEAERTAKEAQEAAKAAQAEAERKVIQVQKTYLQPPVEAPSVPEKDPNEIIPRCTFALIGATRAQIWKIRDILKEEGIRYE